MINKLSICTTCQTCKQKLMKYPNKNQSSEKTADYDRSKQRENEMHLCNYLYLWLTKMCG